MTLKHLLTSLIFTITYKRIASLARRCSPKVALGTRTSAPSGGTRLRAEYLDGGLSNIVWRRLFNMIFCVFMMPAYSYSVRLVYLLAGWTRLAQQHALSPRFELIIIRTAAIFTLYQQHTAHRHGAALKRGADIARWQHAQPATNIRTHTTPGRASL